MARGSASASIRPTACCGKGRGYQLTWMDAKVGDWVVTPRRGKAVEINALWYNALRLLENWLRERDGDEERCEPSPSTPTRARDSFNQRFWYAEGGYLYDVVDGEARRRSRLPPEPDLRHLADHPVLDETRWEAVLDVVRERSAHAGRAALARAASIPTTKPSITATSAPATPPIIRARSGPG